MVTLMYRDGGHEVMLMYCSNGRKVHDDVLWWWTRGHADVL